jgi:hypothetical protein
MKFTYKFNIPRINVDRYRNELDKSMREAVAQAVMEWLDAVLMEIPVWSGASRATFIKLGMQIGMNIPVAPASGNWAHGLFTSRIDRRGEGLSQSTGKVNTTRRRVATCSSTDHAPLADLERISQRQRRA